MPIKANNGAGNVQNQTIIQTKSKEHITLAVTNLEKIMINKGEAPTRLYRRE